MAALRPQWNLTENQSRKISGVSENTCRLNILLSKIRLKMKCQDKLKTFCKWKHNLWKFMGCSESSVCREIYSVEWNHRKEERSIINNLSCHLREQEKEQIKTKVRRSKEIIRIRVEINEIGTGNQ